MKKKHQRLFAFIIFLAMVGLFVPVSAVNAQTEMPFGGLVSYTQPCTCSASLWVFFTPLYLGGPLTLAGPMVYTPIVTTLYANFEIGIPGKYHLGAYTPGVQACYVLVEGVCVPWPAFGLMTKVGTN